MLRSYFCTLLIFTFEFKNAVCRKSAVGTTTVDPPEYPANRTYLTMNEKSLARLKRLQALAGAYGAGIHKGTTMEDDHKIFHIGHYGYWKKSGEFQTCQLNQKDYEPWQIRYDDDQPVMEILFECASTEKCCELECCSSVAWWIIFLSVLGAILLLILCFCVCIRCKKTEKEITEQVQEETDEFLRTGHHIDGSAQKLHVKHHDV